MTEATAKTWPQLRDRIDHILANSATGTNGIEYCSLEKYCWREGCTQEAKTNIGLCPKHYAWIMGEDE